MYKIIQNTFKSYLLFCKFWENIQPKKSISINCKSTGFVKHAMTYIAVDSQNDPGKEALLVHLKWFICLGRDSRIYDFKSIVSPPIFVVLFSLCFPKCILFYTTPMVHGPINLRTAKYSAFLLEIYNVHLCYI